MSTLHIISQATKEELRIECGELLGWKLVPRLFHNGEWKNIPTWVNSRLYRDQPEDYCAAGQMIGGLPPDYSGDRELAVGLISKLTRNQKIAFVGAVQELMLCHVVGVVSNYPDDHLRLAHLLTADPMILCMAFVWAVRTH